MQSTYANFNSIESLAVVHTNDAADHLGNNNHVAEVSLDDLGLLADGSITLL